MYSCFLSLYGGIIFHCINNHILFIHSSVWHTFGLFILLEDYKYYFEHSQTSFCVDLFPCFSSQNGQYTCWSLITWRPTFPGEMWAPRNSFLVAMTNEVLQPPPHGHRILSACIFLSFFHPLLRDRCGAVQAMTNWGVSCQTAQLLVILLVFLSPWPERVRAFQRHLFTDGKQKTGVVLGTVVVSEWIGFYSVVS